MTLGSLRADRLDDWGGAVPVRVRPNAGIHCVADFIRRQTDDDEPPVHVDPSFLVCASLLQPELFDRRW